MSADPLAVHAPGQADLNLYAYVSGRVLQAVDPVGLEDGDPEALTCEPDGGSEMSDGSVQPPQAATPAPACGESSPVAEGTAYEINRTTARAEPVPMTPKAAGLTIQRPSGVLVPTTQATVDEINDPSRTTPEAAHALWTLAGDAATYAGDFPDDYYVEFSEGELCHALTANPGREGPANETIQETFGLEVRDSPSKAPYHVYESLVGDWDKVQHFVRSATSQYSSGTLATEFIQIGKELIFDEVASWFTDDAGWDPEDMRANNQGQAFGAEMAKQHQSGPVEGLAGGLMQMDVEAR